VSSNLVKNAAPGRLRQILAEQGVAHGTWCMLPSAFATEIVSAAGCDWILIDLQHGPIDDGALRVMIQAADIRSTPVLVRVPWNDPAAIMRSLDAGAAGVVIPMVNNAAEAESAARASRYPPRGYRSWGPARSIMAQPAFTPATGNDQCLCIVMIETVDGFENLDSILDVPNVDGVLVGPVDLRISQTGSTDGAGSAEGDVEMIRAIAAACARRALIPGIWCGTADEARRWRREGYTLLGLHSDAGLIGEGLTAMLAAARGQDER
jgi:4-hydroxy-2-oxoheptanedioate aldolase